MLKQYHGWLVAALATSLLTGDVLADNPFEGIGKGKILKKLRDELIGPPAEKNSPTQANPNSKSQPTLAQPRLNVPALPQPQTTPNSPQTPLSNTFRYSLRPAPQTATSEPSATQSPISGDDQAEISTPTQVVSADFGMRVQTDKQGHFVVTHVDPRGNAAQAGVSRGDWIVQAGGAELNGLNELNEIIKVLGPGDQLGFQLFRRGQKMDVQIQFGEPKALPPTDSVARLEEPKSPLQSRYDFVPPASKGNSYRSVLERGDNSMPQDAPTPRSRSNFRPTAPKSTLSAAQQQQLVDQLDREFEQVRQRSTTQSDQFGNSILEGPALDGPGQ